MKANMPLFSLYFLFAVVFTAETRRQLTESFRVDTNNNAFGDFALGRGFDSSQGAMKEAHAFREGEVTYDFMPITQTRTKCVTIQSAKDAAEKLDVYGQMAVSYKMINADGFLEFNRGEEQMERNAFFKCVIDRTLFTASINTDEIYPSEEDLANGGSSSHLLNPTVDVLNTAEEKRALIGDKYVSSITYGRRYEVEIQVSYSKQNSWDQLQGGVKASMGIGFLKVSAEIKLNMESSETSEDLKMTVASTSTGFVEATPMKFPVAAKCRTAEDSGLEIDVDVDVGRRLLMQQGRRSLQDCPTEEQISVGEQMQAMLQENIDAMNAMDLDNNLEAESGLSKDDLFAKIGTAYPLSYTTGTNSMWYPIMAENAFTQEVTRNIKQAWMIFTELQQFIDELDRMSETLYDNYHLLSGATTLSDTFMNYRQALTEEIMVLQNEIREYTNLHPNTIKQSTIFFWTMNMRNDPDQEDKVLDHLTMDHIHQKVYRLMGMEDSLMEDTNPIGDTCVFHGITADIDGVRVRFAGDVVFGEHKVKHVLFDEDGDTVSLGYIDRKDGSAQELVYVKKDCSLFRVGTTVWFKGGRYEIVQIGSEEHMDGLKVVKEMLTNIRIEIKPVSTTTEALAIMVTAGGLNYLTLRGDDDHQAVFRVDDNGLLMYLNGYVCGTNFGEYEAKMVCSNLGFSGLNTFETSQQLPANSAWQLALTTMTDLECPMYSTKPEDCTFFVEGDDGFGVCDLQSGVHIQCTNNVIVESVHFSAGTEEGCVSYSHERQSVSRACNGGSSDIINVDEVHVTGNLCASMFTTDTEGPFCTVPTGSSTIDNHCSHVATGGAISMAEFEIIEPNSITMEGYVISSTPFPHDVTVTLEVGDYRNSEVKNLNYGFYYPAFDCSYKGRTFTVTASLEDHWCTVSRASRNYVGWPVWDQTENTSNEALTDILREDTLFVVTCIAFPTAAPTVAPSIPDTAAPTMAPSIPDMTSAVPTFAPSASGETEWFYIGDTAEGHNTCNQASRLSQGGGFDTLDACITDCESQDGFYVAFHTTGWCVCHSASCTLTRDSSGFNSPAVIYGAVLPTTFAPSEAPVTSTPGDSATCQAVVSALEGYGLTDLHTINWGSGTNRIHDGGDDMYDYGNYINYGGTTLTYLDNCDSDDAQSYQMSRGESIQVTVIESSSDDTVSISGNLGADGDGTVSGGAYSTGGFHSYWKQVCDTNDPSVIHLWLTNSPDAVHSFTTDSGDDEDTLTGVSGYSVIYILMSAEDPDTSQGVCYTDAYMQNVVDALVTAVEEAEPSRRLLFRQTAPYTWTVGELRLNATSPSADQYSILDELEDYRNAEGLFHFVLRYPNATPDVVEYEWTQASNPTSELIDGYTGIQIPYTGLGWGGLERSDYALMDGSVDEDWWFYAVGAYGLWEDAYPAYAKTREDFYYGQTQVELYIIA